MSKIIHYSTTKVTMSKLEGAGDNDSANIEKSLLTVATQFATLSTVPAFRHAFS